MPKTLVGQSREIIYEVFKYMTDEAEYGVKNIKQVQNRVAAATNISVKTVARIIHEGKALDKQKNKSFVTPGLVRVRKQSTMVQKIDVQFLNRVIRSYHEDHQEYPTFTQLLRKLNSDGDFTGSKTTLRTILKKLGFKLAPVGKITVVLEKKMSSPSKKKNTKKKLKSVGVPQVKNMETVAQTIRENVDEKYLQQDRTDIDLIMERKQNVVEPIIKQELEIEHTPQESSVEIHTLAAKEEVDIEISNIKRELDVETFKEQMETFDSDLEPIVFKLEQLHNYCGSL